MASNALIVRSEGWESSTLVDTPALSFPAPNTTQGSSAHTLDKTGYCLLSLDGGGVRGLSTLYILKNIMDRLNYLREEAGLRPRKPCEIFDMIGGTSTGGLIAIMLGRLEMSVDECITAYLKLMKQVFEKREKRSFVDMLGRVQPRFSSSALEEAIAQVITSRGLSLDERLQNGTKPRCKVFVCTKFQKANTITRLRSYRIPAGSDLQPTILEAALATSAAPTYFSPAAIKGINFVDGAIGVNNPSVQVEQEAFDIWCEETGYLQPLVKCFISIGTGHPGIHSVSDKGLIKMIETMQKVVTETEKTNNEFLSRWRSHVDKGRCFRFNVEQGLGDVKLAEFDQQELIQVATSSYLDEHVTKAKVKTCVENLRTKEYKPNVEQANLLQQLAVEQMKQPPEQFSRTATPSEIAELLRLGNDQLRAPRVTINTLLLARHYFSKALYYLRKDPSTSPKQVSRVCQKLLETSLGLSIMTRDNSERKEHADQARQYGETALDNVLRAQDACMAAQVEFMLANVDVWKVYLQARASGVQPSRHPKRRDMEGLVEERLGSLRRFANLDMETYETQGRKYLAYLRE